MVSPCLFTAPRRIACASGFPLVCVSQPLYIKVWLACAAQNVLVYVMQGILKLLHPFMPFITEEIWHSMPIVADKDNSPESIMISAWPVYDEKLHFAAEQTDFTKVVDAIRAIRVQRNELNVPPSKKV